jgi:hypothetical protein
VAINYNKYRDTYYFPTGAPDEYRPTYITDELKKISRVVEIFAKEMYPTKSARVVTADETLTVLDDVILASGDITITLYDAAGITSNQGIKDNAGHRVTVKNIGDGTITIETVGNATIEGELDAEMPVKYTALEFFSDGSNWHVI